MRRDPDVERPRIVAEYLRVAEAAAYLGVSARTFLSMRQRKGIAAFRFGGAQGPPHFKRSDLDAWAERFREGHCDGDREIGKLPAKASVGSWAEALR